MALLVGIFLSGCVTTETTTMFPDGRVSVRKVTGPDKGAMSIARAAIRARAGLPIRATK